MIRDSVYGVGQVEERTGDCVYDNSNARAAQFRRKPSRISRGKRDSHVLHVSDSHVLHVRVSHVRHVRGTSLAANEIDLSSQMKSKSRRF